MFSGLNNKKGFLLIELIVAVFVIVVGILSVYFVISQSISKIHESSLRLTAAYLAQEGMEIVRNIRDTNWVKGEENWDEGLGADLAAGEYKEYEADYDDPSLEKLDCSSCGYEDLSPLKLKIDEENHDEENNKGFYNYDSGDETSFRRKIKIEKISGEELKVSVEVLWKYKGKENSITVTEILHNWY